MTSELIVGPTFEEMSHPNTIEAKTRQKAMERRKGSALRCARVFLLDPEGG